VSILLLANGLEARSEMFIRLAEVNPVSWETAMILRRFMQWSKFTNGNFFSSLIMTFLFSVLVAKSVEKPADLKYLAKLMPTLVQVFEFD
jgi:hypothetical protein